MNLDATFDISQEENEILILNDSKYIIIMDDKEILFDDEFFFCRDLMTIEPNIDGYVFFFGGRWYIQISEQPTSLTELKYIGKAKTKIPNTSFLGIRSSYELMNGIGLYSEWVKKAKFLGISNLGICEKHTLSGVLVFQKECANNDIKSIIGMTVSIEDDISYDIKLYAKNFQGWSNLLAINTLINVDKQLSITLDQLILHKDDLVIVVDPKTTTYNQALKLKKNDCFDYYQLEVANFLNEEVDAYVYANLEKFLKNPTLQPISITDAFYLEKRDYKARELMWTFAKSFDVKTDNQFFKTKDEYAKELISLFESSCTSWIPLFKAAIKNESILVESCNFSYDTDTRHLPKYVMTKEEASQFEKNEDLFMHLIKTGFKQKNFTNPQKYIDRLKVEIEVLRMGDVIDYFLTLYDIIRSSKEQGLLTGIGRGSAGGSLIAYLMGIIQIDPLEFDLLFERFLNSGRMGEYQDRPNYKLTLEDGSIVELPEGTVVKIIRNKKEISIFIHDIIEGDDLIKY